MALTPSRAEEVARVDLEARPFHARSRYKRSVLVVCSTLLHVTLEICTCVHTHLVCSGTADVLVLLAFALRNRHTFVADAKCRFCLAAITYDLCACFVVHLSLGFFLQHSEKWVTKALVLHLSQIPR